MRTCAGLLARRTRLGRERRRGGAHRRRNRARRERRRGGAHRSRRNRARRERRSGGAHLWRDRARRCRAWRHGRERRRELDWQRRVEVRVEKERGRGRRWSELLSAEQLTAQQQARLRAGQRLTWRAPCRGAEGRRRQLVAVDEVAPATFWQFQVRGRLSQASVAWRFAPATVRALAAGEVLTHDGLVPASTRRGAVRLASEAHGKLAGS